MEEDYEIVPHNEILKLKKEVDELKSSTGHKIKNAMQELTDSVNSMNNLLKVAAEGMRTEESEASSLNKRMDLLINKLDLIADENRKAKNTRHMRTLICNFCELFIFILSSYLLSLICEATGDDFWFFAEYLVASYGSSKLFQNSYPNGQNPLIPKQAFLICLQWG